MLSFIHNPVFFPKSRRLFVHTILTLFWQNAKDFVRAIKSYRVALDQVGARNKQLRGKITANIACAFARMGQYVDAASTFEDVVDLRNFSAGVNSHDAKKTPDVATRFNLVVCHFALGDAPAMRNAFTGLLRLRAFESDDGEDEEDVPAGVGARGVSGIAGDDGYQEIVGDGKDGDANGGDANPKPKRNNARSDLLTAETAVRRKNARGVIIDAAMLIGPEIASTPELGWEELAREMRAFGYKSLANKLEMQKALGYLSTKTNQGRFEGTALGVSKIPPPCFPHCMEYSRKVRTTLRRTPFQSRIYTRPYKTDTFFC